MFNFWPFRRREKIAHDFAASPPLDRVKAKSRGRATMRTRVFRAATGQWEDLGVIYLSAKLIAI